MIVKEFLIKDYHQIINNGLYLQATSLLKDHRYKLGFFFLRPHIQNCAKIRKIPPCTVCVCESSNNEFSKKFSRCREKAYLQQIRHYAITRYNQIFLFLTLLIFILYLQFLFLFLLRHSFFSYAIP